MWLVQVLAWVLPTAAIALAVGYCWGRRAKLQQQASELDRTRQEARTDPLSGAGNRKAFDEHIQLLLSKYRVDRQSFVLVLLDIDNFKPINDTYGHPTGDGVVRQLSDLLGQCVRGSDYVARFGGDEFAIFFADIDEPTAVTVIDRIRGTVEQQPFDGGVDTGPVSITCSVGLAGVRPGDTAETLVARADRALYLAKRLGRNQVIGSADGLAGEARLSHHASRTGLDVT